jgi:heme exporter protein D
MRVAAVSKIETGADRTASAFFAGSCGYAAYLWLAPGAGVVMLAVELAAVAVAAYLVTFRALNAVEPEGRKAPLSVFDLRSFEPMDQDELLLHEEFESVHRSLTELQPLESEPDELLLDEKLEPRELPAGALPATPLDDFERAEQLMIEHFAPARAAEEEPLLLDDILAELGPDSRVVRLFDPEAMPTPGQLKSRIDRHLEPGAAPADIPDAGQALHDALDELRRSIR